MKDIILLAMSTLPREAISADDFSTPKADVKDCRSQLESVVRYFVNASQTEDVLILGLCTAPTLEAEGAPAAAAPEEVKYFINFSNHPSKSEKGEPVWNERQIKAAEKYVKLDNKKMIVTALKVLVAAAIACMIPRAFFWLHPMNKYLTLIISAIIGVIVYLLAVKVLKVNEINDLVGLLKRKMKKT